MLFVVQNLILLTCFPQEGNDINKEIRNSMETHDVTESGQYWMLIPVDICCSI